ncbi:efflux transporter outer membrane subunit [Sphingobacterium phlebotomi]|uniref:Efflux transporter outer membrane subunit n=1 Tax=Sphingobacterium phlebotomi TaxID=2605433 RepID=A0A5D4GX10_9SPHI|nr:efflux transporter outer membrane subunit [Sphingobacterium phlebotomi]TYR31795.1 efflux transporter outer membrane subunit [Sphingobacterium phlebotomi]
MINLRNIVSLGFLFGLCFMTGCRSSQQLAKQQPAEVPEEFVYSHGQLDIDTTEALATLSYHEFFADEQLIALIDSGLVRNNNMLVAIKQIESAQETMKQAKWGNLPFVDLSAGVASITRPSDNSMNGIMASQFMGQSYMEDYSSKLTISWEADIWGKIKSQKAATLAGYLETQEATNAVRTSLIAGIAQSYYNLLLLDQQKVISEQNLAIVDSTLEITKVQLRLGMTTSLAVQQLENSRDNLLKAIRVIDENRGVQENALNALVGEMPQHLTKRGNIRDLQLRDNLATGVPAALLSRRPDVKQAEYAFLRSSSGVKVARANMYPALRITAEGGLNAFTASNWFNVPGSLFGVLSGSLTQPLLQGRRLKTAYNQANIQAEQAELQFKESVLQAVTEVSTILEQISSLQDQQVYNNQLVKRNQELIEQAKILFKNDMATYLEILTAQQTKLQAELDQMQVKSQLLYAEVALYKALGGGVM